jgi:hypothetical protein
MNNERETTRPGQGRARVLSDEAISLASWHVLKSRRSRILARRKYAGNCRPNSALDRSLTMGFETDREDPTSPSFRRKRAPESEGYVGQAAIPPFTRRAHSTTK